MSESSQNLINSIMSALAETTSNGGIIASKGASSEVVSMEVPAAVPKAPRSPRLKPTPKREAPKPKKDKQKKTMPMRESPRKHTSTQVPQKENPIAQGKGKVVDLEAEEGAKDIDIEGADTISKFQEYIPLRWGKAKFPKDPDEGQFLLNAPLL